MLYGKHIATHYQPTAELSESERVLYTNALSLPPTVVLCLVMGERERAVAVRLTPTSAAWLLCSCLIGVGISYTGWRLKDLVTATTFTLVGVLNKMGTLVLAAVAFPGATSPLGFLCLTACLFFGMLYSDAPMAHPRPLSSVTGGGSGGAHAAAAHDPETGGCSPPAADDGGAGAAAGSPAAVAADVGGATSAALRARPKAARNGGGGMYAPGETSPVRGGGGGGGGDAHGGTQQG